MVALGCFCLWLEGPCALPRGNSNGSMKCSLCASGLNQLAPVFFMGEEVTCQQVEGVLSLEETVDSPRCEASQISYSGTCCSQDGATPASADVPCNICNTNSLEYDIDAKASVIIDGDLHICGDVFQSLFSTQAQSSERCINTQRDMFDYCCGDIIAQQPPSGVNAGDLPPPTMQPTKSKPTRQFETWRTGLLESRASEVVVSSGVSILFLLAAGLMISRW